MNENAAERSPRLSPSIPDVDPLEAARARVEGALHGVLARATRTTAPRRLRDGLAYAVFPGGARVRPLLCLAVAEASGGAGTERAVAAAAAVELVHCASLVHDDLPCFDDADLRRGKPTLHKAFSEGTGVLVGDALLVLAFETLARAGASGEAVLLAEATGPGRGLIAGQAWEAEPAVPLDEYHRAKTAALFEAAAGMGAIAAGASPAPWRALGRAVGQAYQAADDLGDALQSSRALGKTTGRDATLRRPSIVARQGVEKSRESVAALLRSAHNAVPPCIEDRAVRAWLEAIARRLALA
jgi:geranylgeranyl diphosphate synthase type II